jgi:hypothetical protein
VITTTRRAIPLTGTWFHHVGRAPYELLGLVDHTSGPRTPLTTAPRPTLPRWDIAA